MMAQARSRRNATAVLLPIATVALAAGIFVADTITTTDVAVGALYVVVVLLAARFCAARNLVLVGAGCVGLMILSYLLSPPVAPTDEALLNLVLRSTAIAVVTFLAMQSQSAQTAAREGANLLDLAHDTIFVRNMADVISYWNRGAEELYGWTRDEAIGKVSHQLLRTIFPAPLEEINAQLFATGRWEGELIHAKRDGTRVTVASRWSLERDEHGRPAAILETNNDVTERKRAEETLREKASLLDLTHDTIFVRNMDDVITYWNRGAEELYGWTRDEAMGKVSHHLTQTIFPAPLEEINAHLLATGQWEGELIHAKRDGTRVTVASRWSLERNEHGRPAAILETNNDITERKRAEQTLRESERRYRNIFETAGVSIWEENFCEVEAAIDALKAQGVRDFRQYAAEHPEFVRRAMSMVKIVDVNDATVKLFGAGSKEELLGSLHDIFTPETEKAFVEELIAIAEGRISFASETSLQSRKGERLKVLFTITFPPPPAKLDSVLVTIVDITERERAEILTAQVFESAPDGICIVGRDYRYRRVNPVYGRRWGMPAERAVGMRVSELLGDDDFDRTIKPNLDRCFAGEEVTFEWVAESRGRRYLQVSYSPLRSGSEEVEAALVIQRDLTEHMQASEALRAAQAELAHVARMSTLGELAASIAHEINQPLAGIMMGASAGLRWLHGEKPNLAAARQSFARIQNDGKRAADVISRVRDLARKSPIRMEPLKINNVVLDVVALMRSEIDRNRVELRTRLADDLPTIHGDVVQLQQVILNLMVNAIEAMHDDKRRELLISSSKDDAQNVLVSVCDSGPGLDPATIDRIFDSFYTTKPSGMGMGLSICRSIIETHGGRLTARANMPRGAIFEFALPRENSAGSPTPAEVMPRPEEM